MQTWTQGGEYIAAKRIKEHSSFVQVSILVLLYRVLCFDLDSMCSCVTVTGTDP